MSLNPCPDLVWVHALVALTLAGLLTFSLYSLVAEVLEYMRLVMCPMNIA